MVPAGLMLTLPLLSESTLAHGMVDGVMEFPPMPCLRAAGVPPAVEAPGISRALSEETMLGFDEFFEKHRKRLESDDCKEPELLGSLGRSESAEWLSEYMRDSAGMVSA